MYAERDDGFHGPDDAQRCVTTAIGTPQRPISRAGTWPLKCEDFYYIVQSRV